MGKVQAAQVAAVGPYVCFVQLGGDVTELLSDASEEEASDAAVIEHCLIENGRALDIVERMLLDNGEG